MTDAPVLAVESLHAAYGPSRVLHGVTLAARAGEVVSLLGRNGAGKSTTLKAIMGLVDVTAGSVRLDGRDITGLPPHAVSRLGVGWVPEDRRIFPDLTVAENLEVGRKPAPPGATAWTVERAFAVFPALRALARRRAGSLSGGEQQMLTVARTMMGNPRVLLLDEPSEGLAPVIVRTLGEQVGMLRKEGLTIVLSEQNLKFAARLADRAYVIERGEIRWEGAMGALMADDAARRQYLSV